MIQTRKAELLDVVEILEDLPEYNVKHGERGAVVEVFDEPEEAYMVEFVDDSGTSSRIVDWVRPNQIININTLAKEIFERGIDLLNGGRQLKAEKEFRRAFESMPKYIGILHNSMVKSFEGSSDWERGIEAMRLILRIDPQFKPARNNLAIAFLNLGVQKAKEGDIDAATRLYYTALSVEASQEIVSEIRRKLAAIYASLGVHAYKSGHFEESLTQMGRACAFDPNDNTRHNFGLAYAFLAESLLAQGKLEKSIWCFESAEDTGLVLPEYLNNYGVALALSNRLDEAVHAFERALELAPENKVIQANLERAKNYDVAGFNTEELSAEFYPPPPMQSQDYVIA